VLHSNTLSPVAIIILGSVPECLKVYHFGVLCWLHQEGCIAGQRLAISGMASVREWFAWRCLLQEGRTPLHLAAVNGKRKVVVCLLLAGAGVNTADTVSATPPARQGQGRGSIDDAAGQAVAALPCHKHRGWH
jgi:hypothetical protein